MDGPQLTKRVMSMIDAGTEWQAHAWIARQLADLIADARVGNNEAVLTRLRTMDQELKREDLSRH